MTDITRTRKFAEKKTMSISCAEIRHGDAADTTSHEIFNLPANCLITKAGIIVDEAGQSSLTVDLGFDGGNELGDDLAIDSTGYVEDGPAVATLTLSEGTPNTLSSGTVNSGLNILTGTGKTVTAKFSADPSQGKFYALVEYIEYTKGNGDYTVYSDA